jgi:outer membrane protein TolC
MKYLRMIDKTHSLAALLCFLAAGCSVGPDYRRPETAAPAVWQEAQQTGIDTQASQLAEWWKEFKDPMLDGLVERAVKNNLDLRIAEARVREERASLAATSAGLWPTLDVSGSYSRNRASQNAVGSPTQGAVVAPIGGRQLEQNFFKPVSIPGGRLTCSAAHAGRSRLERRSSRLRLKSGAAFL